MSSRWRMPSLNCSISPRSIGDLHPCRVQGIGDFNGNGKDCLRHYKHARNAADPTNGAFVVGR